MIFARFSFNSPLLLCLLGLIVNAGLLVGMIVSRAEPFGRAQTEQRGLTFGRPGVALSSPERMIDPDSSKADRSDRQMDASELGRRSQRDAIGFRKRSHELRSESCARLARKSVRVSSDKQTTGSKPACRDSGYDLATP